MRKVEFKTTESVTAAICKMMSVNVKALYRTVIFDNEPELAMHETIAAELGGDVYFAHSCASWERGTNENALGVIRQYFPKNCDFSTITDEQINEMQDKLNNRSRKCIGIKKPNQLLFGIDPPVALSI